MGQKKQKKQEKALPLPAFFSKDLRLLSVMLIRYGQLLAALGTTRCEHAAAVLGGHSLTETVLVDSPAIVWLECSFHLDLLFFVTISHFGLQK